MSYKPYAFKSCLFFYFCFFHRLSAFLCVYESHTCLNSRVVIPEDFILSRGWIFSDIEQYPTMLVPHFSMPFAKDTFFSSKIEILMCLCSSVWVAIRLMPCKAFWMCFFGFKCCAYQRFNAALLSPYKSV